MFKKSMDDSNNLKPIIILVEPQLGENIGAVARAMLNCGLRELRIVKPRDGWPNPKAVRASAGADIVINSAGIFNSLEDAVSDIQFVYACTARKREVNKELVDFSDFGRDLFDIFLKGNQSAILFGGEKSGLSNKDISLADKLLFIPLNPDFSSLNLAQAVLLISYAWFQKKNSNSIYSNKSYKNSSKAKKEDLINLFEHLEKELTISGFLHPAEKIPSMKINLRAIFQRAELTDNEVKTLRGVITALKR